MATIPRRLNPLPKKRGVNTAHEWNRLLRSAIRMAKTAGDSRRLRTLETALQQGSARMCLKRMGIISEADLQREFGRKR